LKQVISFIKNEFQAVYLFLARNKREAVIISIATLVLILERYYQVRNEWLSNLIYFAAIPLVVIILLRRNPLDFGLRPGKPRIWIFHVIVFCLIAYPILHFTSVNPSLQAYYRIEPFYFLNFFLTTAASLLATEFLFRGFLLFGLKERFKEGSILIQAVPFVLVHFGKPDLETISTIITGIYFGYMCYRGNSFWPAFIVHMFINIFFITSVNLR